MKKILCPSMIALTAIAAMTVLFAGPPNANATDQNGPNAVTADAVQMDMQNAATTADDAANTSQSPQNQISENAEKFTGYANEDAKIAANAVNGATLSRTSPKVRD